MRGHFTVRAILMVTAGLLIGSGYWLAARPDASRDEVALGREHRSGQVSGSIEYATPEPAQSGSRWPRSARTPSRTPFTTPSVRLTRLARRFVRAACEYDARREGRLDFVARAGRYATGSEQLRLTRSARARLPWRVLRDRNERARIKVVGVTRDARTLGVVKLVVETITTTRTNFAVLRDFAQVTLTVTRTRSGWRVSDAVGAGL